MDRLLQEKCDLLVENKNIISETYKWGADAINLAAAYLFTAAGRKADKDELKNAEQIIKEQSGVFSVFRGNVKVPILCKMILSGDATRYFAKTLELYDLLSKHKWFSNDFRAMAAAVLCDRADTEEPGDLISRTNEMYLIMKEQHPWLTGGEDLIFAAILASSGAELTHLADEAEKNYNMLKEAFGNKNAVQSLSHVLALGDKPAEEKSAKVISLFNGLKNAGHKYAGNYELAALGTLALLNLPHEQLVQDIVDADEYLKQHKGFGNFRLGSDMRLMYAAQMVLQRYAQSAEGKDIVMASMLAFTLAMEFTAIIIISSTSAITATMLNNG